VTAGAVDAEHENVDLLGGGGGGRGAGAHDGVGEVVAHHDFRGLRREGLAFLGRGVGVFGLGEEFAGAGNRALTRIVGHCRSPLQRNGPTDVAGGSGMWFCGPYSRWTHVDGAVRVSAGRGCGQWPKSGTRSADAQQGGGFGEFVVGEPVRVCRGGQGPLPFARATAHYDDKALWTLTLTISQVCYFIPVALIGKPILSPAMIMGPP
jgi:hypothetical protein